ncbi:MAG TPA: protein-L-isoaspartate(D-aspartate) O-methyltransferase [Terriglobia bacterium]|nr:protein-L-isoaspartate(D-aspartate) O-methyltransferase [Terriglobia bacterium]
MNELMPFEAERRRMIDVQLRRRGIRDERVLDAMLRVPRHQFVPPAFIERAYQDRPLPIGNAETISQPYMVAAMTEAASVKPGDKVFEAGTGSGYQAAILAALGAKVYSLERNPRLADGARARLARLGYDVEVICADASQGYAPAAPYDAMLVTAASPSIPGVLIDQLAEGGRLVIPVGGRQGQRLERVIKTAEGVSRQSLEACQFVPLIGKYGWPEEASPAP